MQMTTPLIIKRQVAAFSSNNLSTSCMPPIQDLSRNLRTMMIPSSPITFENDKTIDVVYEDEADDEANF